MRETEKSGQRQWRNKLLIFDQKHGFKRVKQKNRVRTSGGKSVKFLIKNMDFKELNGKSGPLEWRKKCLITTKNMDFKALNGKIGSARVGEKVSNFYQKHGF